MIEKEAVELMLLAGDPVPITDVVYMPPITLRAIRKVGWKIYNEYLHFATLNKESLAPLVEGGMDHISDWALVEMMSKMPSASHSFRDRFCAAFTFFFGCPVKYETEGHFFYIEVGTTITPMDDHMFLTLRSLVRKQVTPDGNDDISVSDSASAKTRAIMERQRKARVAVARAKQRQSTSDGGDSISFVGLISAYCAKNTSGINVLNVWDMTVYAFNIQINKLRIIEQYELDYHSLLAGSKNVDLKHWLVN